MCSIHFRLTSSSPTFLCEPDENAEQCDRNVPHECSPTVSTNKSMADVTINKDGPYHVKGDVEIKDAEGNLIESGGEFWLCRCGQSATKPFCDGTHKKVGFTD